MASSEAATSGRPISRRWTARSPRRRSSVSGRSLRRASVPRLTQLTASPRRATADTLARSLTQRLETKLEGVVLVEPVVHGDERGFMVESFRTEAWAELGVDTP